jgi:hypothetical protein
MKHTLLALLLWSLALTVLTSRATAQASFTFQHDGEVAILTGYSGDDEVEEVVIPPTHEGRRVVAITNNVGQAQGLRRLVIPEGVVTVGNYAFQYCPNLTNIMLPASLTNIGLQAFTSCSSLTRFVVEPTSISFGDKDGVLFSRDMTTLVCYPAGLKGDYHVPGVVRRIGVAGFFGCNQLAGVHLPDGLTEIGAVAFDGCNQLTRVAVPDGVTELPVKVFSACSSLEKATLGEGLIKIAAGAFTECHSLLAVFPRGRTTGFRGIYPWKRNECYSPLLRGTERLVGRVGWVSGSSMATQHPAPRRGLSHRGRAVRFPALLASWTNPRGGGTNGSACAQMDFGKHQHPLEQWGRRFP